METSIKTCMITHITLALLNDKLCKFVARSIHYIPPPPPTDENLLYYNKPLLKFYYPPYYIRIEATKHKLLICKIHQNLYYHPCYTTTTTITGWSTLVSSHEKLQDGEKMTYMTTYVIQLC